MKNRKDQPSGNSDKEVPNAGSGAFNQGIEQDPDYNKGTKVSDEEKLTGHTPSRGKEKEKPKEGNMGKNNARKRE